MQALYFQYVQVARDDYERLKLAHNEEEEIPPEEQLCARGIDEVVGARVRLEYRNEDNAADPYCQHRVERRHGRAVVVDGVDLVDGGLYHF